MVSTGTVKNCGATITVSGDSSSEHSCRGQFRLVNIRERPFDPTILNGSNRHLAPSATTFSDGRHKACNPEHSRYLQTKQTAPLTESREQATPNLLDLGCASA